MVNTDPQPWDIPTDKDRFLAGLRLTVARAAADLPAWAGADALVPFLHENMKPYEDKPGDIARGLAYALGSEPGQGGFVLLAHVDDRLAGALVMLRTGMSGYVPPNLLLFVSVAPALRGLGIGARLIERAKREADGDIKLHVEPDNPAKRLYERQGLVGVYTEMRYKHE